MPTALEYMQAVRDCLNLLSKERPDGRTATNSELRRWIKSGGVNINNRIVTEIHEQVELPVRDLVLFPRGRTITLLPKVIHGEVMDTLAEKEA